MNFRCLLEVVIMLPSGFISNKRDLDGFSVRVILWDILAHLRAVNRHEVERVVRGRSEDRVTTALTHEWTQ